jgi:spore maturation protein CgeB
MSRLIACPICGDKRFRFLLNDAGAQVVKCAACRFIYVNPQPTEGELERLYREYYHDEEHGLADSLCCRRPVFEHGVDILNRLADRGKLLDIGCGTGDFLVHAREGGWEVVGVELSARAAAHARDRGLQVRTGTMTEQGFPSDYFSAATLWDVLEHLPEPRREIKEVCRILKPGGILIVRVPNTHTQLMKRYARKTLCKPGNNYLSANVHLNHFTPRTLGLLLESSGFKVLREEPGVSEAAVFSEGLPLWMKRHYCRLARVAAMLTSIQIGLTVVHYSRKR